MKLRKFIIFAVTALILSSFQFLYAHDASFPLPSDKINEYPFNMVGIVSSREWWGSGTAISQKVVLSAAHVFFNEEILDWHPGPFEWNLRHSPSNRSFDISARSYRHFSDYAEATRRFDENRLDTKEGISWEQFQRDVITLIFYEDVAHGGSAEWSKYSISGSSKKMIVGYPNLGYDDSDPRRHTMHSTSLSGSIAEFVYVDHTDRLTSSASRLFISYDLSTGPGNSGGPVFGLLDFSSGTDWGVVGINVGGTTGEDALAVGIDLTVYDLIYDAISTTDSTPIDDHGDTRGSATIVELNRSISGNLETEGDIDYFRFEINSAGKIIAFTTGDTDTLGTLQNNLGNVITTNDDGGSSKNFLIKRVVERGIYDIAVSNLSYKETGNYSFRVDFTETINLPDLAVDFVGVDKSSAVAGETIRVDFDRSNKGVEDSGEFARALYLSKDKIITTGDTLLVDFSKTTASAGESKEFYFEVTIPTDTIPGIYYIGYILDSDMKIQESDETNNTGFAEITVVEPPYDDGGLVLDGLGRLAGENIQHPNGNVFTQVLLTGPSIRLKAKPGQITRVSFMDEDEDIVQVEFSGAGTFTVTLDPATFLPPALPPRYNQQIEYVTGKTSVVIEGADSSTFFSIFTVGRINAVNQALFPEGQVYDAEADVKLVEVINSTGFGGMQFANAVFSGSIGKVGVDARGIPIAVRLTIGDIDVRGIAVPYLLFGQGSFTVPAGNPGLRITGGDLKQTNSASIVVAERGSTTPGFDRLITQNNFKSDNTPQPTQNINATFSNEDGDEITVELSR